MRESWTDDRLDHLNRRVEEGFAHVDRRFEQVDKRFERVEAELVALRQDMNSRLESMQEANNALQRTMVQFAGVTYAAYAAFFSSQVALFLTLL